MQKSINECQQQNYRVQMSENYPFGQLRQRNNQQALVLVRKKLAFRNQKELDILNKMAEFLQALSNQHLISLNHTQQTNDGKYYFFYQYVPLTLGRWILDLGDDVIQELEFQMINLANYLTQKGIKFRFEPVCLGLSKQIKVKYFLRQFSIDFDCKLTSFKEISEDITRFFSDFRHKAEQPEENSSNLADRKSADSANLYGSITTRQSWEVKSSKSSNSTKANMIKNLSLSAKIQNSKKKSLQILQRLKNLKSLQG